MLPVWVQRAQQALAVLVQLAQQALRVSLVPLVCRAPLVWAQQGLPV